MGRAVSAETVVFPEIASGGGLAAGFAFHLSRVSEGFCYRFLLEELQEELRKRSLVRELSVLFEALPRPGGRAVTAGKRDETRPPGEM
jgi:hypothetical protein